MNNPSRFDEQLRAALAVPAAEPDFVDRLRQQLLAQARRPAPQPAPRPRRWALAGLALLLAVAVLLALGPQRVLAQVLDWLGGYIPGIGFVESEAGLRVLESPVALEREGITLRVEQGLIDANSTRITLYFEGIDPQQWPSDEADAGCLANPYLLTPDGERFESYRGGGGGGPNWRELSMEAPSLPAAVGPVTLVAPCVPGTQEGAAPQDWQLRLNFIPAPEGFEVLPILRLPDSPPATAPAEAGIRLTVNQMVAMQDGYLFPVTFSWADTPYEFVSISQLQLLDGSGNPILFEVDYNNHVSDFENKSETWSIRTQTTQIASPLTFRLPAVSISRQLSLEQRPTIEIDLGDSPQNQQVWQVGETLVVEGHSVEVIEARFVDALDGTFGLQLVLRVDPQQISSAGFVDPDNQSQMLFGGGGGSGDGGLTQLIGYDYRPTGVRRIELSHLEVILSGPWETQVDLPSSAAAGQTESATVDACFGSTNYQQISKPVSAGQLSGTLLIQDFSAGGMLPEIALISLQDGQRRSVATGGWAFLSPDGRQVAYGQDGVRLFEIASGQDRLLLAGNYSPMAWSPDGEQLLLRSQGLSLLDVQTGSLQSLSWSTQDVVGVAGWLPDGEHIVVSRLTRNGTELQAVELSSGVAEHLHTFNNVKGGFATLSPDGQWATYGEQLFGGFNYSLHLVQLPGGTPRVLAESSHQMQFVAGAWMGAEQLLVNVLDVDRSGWLPPLLLNVKDCTLYSLPLPGVQVLGWAP